LRRTSAACASGRNCASNSAARQRQRAISRRSSSWNRTPPTQRRCAHGCESCGAPRNSSTDAPLQAHCGGAEAAEPFINEVLRALRGALGDLVFLVESQSLDRLAADEVPLDDLVDVGDGDVAVPDAFRVDDHRAAERAVVEAAGLVGADLAVEAARPE